METNEGGWCQGVTDESERMKGQPAPVKVKSIGELERNSKNNFKSQEQGRDKKRVSGE